MSLSRQFLKNKYYLNKRKFLTEKELKSEFSEAFSQILKSEQKFRSFNMRKISLMRNVENSILKEKLKPMVKIKANKILMSFKDFLDQFEK